MARQYFVGDDVLFEGVFKKAGIEQTPSAVLATIKKTDGTVIVENVAGAISGNNVQYQYNNLVEGSFKLYLTADFGADERTGVITFNVKPKDGKAQ